ncbi:hypothetical protein DPX16_20575 [Anabarilius grahami]|uniref:Uncharacterized protein n=1 Tax=Anabarilius grahami TaxID=495550 RepID=A0A3N0YL66_ANAGA|nr:hypothetical protein DPX16_20575 [Anabarilius grahami]
MRNLESELPESKGDPTKREQRKSGAGSREWNGRFWRVFGNSQVKAKGAADRVGDKGAGCVLSPIWIYVTLVNLSFGKWNK